jgi:hypothetical protein
LGVTPPGGGAAPMMPPSAEVMVFTKVWHVGGGVGALNLESGPPHQNGGKLERDLDGPDEVRGQQARGGRQNLKVAGAPIDAS